MLDGKLRREPGEDWRPEDDHVSSFRYAASSSSSSSCVRCASTASRELEVDEESWDAGLLSGWNGEACGADTRAWNVGDMGTSNTGEGSREASDANVGVWASFMGDDGVCGGVDLGGEGRCSCSGDNFLFFDFGGRANEQDSKA